MVAVSAERAADGTAALTEQTVDMLRKDVRDGANA